MRGVGEGEKPYKSYEAELEYDLDSLVVTSISVRERAALMAGMMPFVCGR